MKVLMDKLAENIRLTLFSLSLDEFAFRSQTENKEQNRKQPGGDNVVLFTL